MIRPLRILIADDEADIRQYFRRLLPRFGHVVVGEAENGKQLVDLFLAERPDLVITDVRMPEMSGIEAAQEIAKHAPIPIIIVSAFEPPSHQNGSVIVDCLVKPIASRELAAAIERAGGAAEPART